MTTPETPAPPPPSLPRNLAELKALCTTQNVKVAINRVPKIPEPVDGHMDVKLNLFVNVVSPYADVGHCSISFKTPLPNASEATFSSGAQIVSIKEEAVGEAWKYTLTLMPGAHEHVITSKTKAVVRAT